MLKRFFTTILARWLFGDPEDYCSMEYRCTRCGDTKESIWEGGCKAMEPCTIAPLALVDKKR